MSTAIAAAPAANNEDEDLQNPEKFVRIDYTECFCDGLFAIRTNMAFEELLNSSMSVLILGEGNFTFATALAAYRKGWGNIYVSRFPERETLREFHEVVQLNMLKISENLQKGQTYFFGNEPEVSTVLTTIAEKMNSLHSLNEPSIILPAEMQKDPEVGIDLGNNDGGWIKEEIDATNLRPFLLNSANFFPTAVLFQCPYAQHGSHSNLVAGLFQSVSRLPQSLQPEFVFIGIANRNPYPMLYGLGTLFGDLGDIRNKAVRIPDSTDSVIQQSGYKFVGADLEFIKEILLLGYKHTTNKYWLDHVHNQILEQHAMLCFKKQTAEVPIAQMDRLDLEN